MATSATGAVQPTSGSTQTIPAGSRATAAVTEVAQSHLIPPASSPVPLVGAQPYDFKGNLGIAFTLIRQKKSDDARSLLLKIEQKLKDAGIPKDSLDPALCSFGIAITYPEGSPKRNPYLEATYNNLQIVYDNKQLWDGLEIKEKSSNYLYFKRLLRKLKLVLPQERSDWHSILDSRMEECSRFMIPLDHAIEKVVEGDHFLEGENYDEARRCYYEALDLIHGQLTPDYMLEQADCYLRLAKTYLIGGQLRLKWVKEASIIIFDLHKQRETLNTDLKCTKPEAFLTLYNSLLKLCVLTPPNQADLLREIVEKMKDCASHIPADKIPSSRKVSKEPPEKLCDFQRIFLRLIFITVAGAAVAVLYQRCIVKEN